MQRRKALICMLALWLAAMVVYGMGLRYSGEPVSVEGVRVFVRDDRAEAFAAELTWDGETDSVTYTIPDTVDGAPVKGLGGLAGQSFRKGVYAWGIIMPETYRGAERWHSGLPENAQAVTVPVYLHIGRYVTAIGDSFPNEPVGYYAWSDDAQSVIVTLEWHVTCDALNPAFYAENGRLYHRTDGSAVEMG